MSMDIDTQRQKADRLRALHHGPEILILLNAWDAVSAAVIAAAGFDVVASSSAGVAAVLGYPDGQRIPRDEMLAMVGRIASAVDLPVTADMEAGYGDSPADMVALAHELISAGAVGLNLEDAAFDESDPLLDTAAQVEKIRIIRETGAERGVPLVINARTDVYVLEVGPPAQRFDNAVRRLNAYRQAGADCLFVPGVRDAETIERIVRAVDGPINILAGAGTPSIPELARLGVARISVGSGAMRATLGLLNRVADELRGRGTYTKFTEDALSFDEVNRLMDRTAG